MRRYTYAGNLNEADVDIAIIAALLGHKDIQTSRIYVKVNDKSMVAAADKLSVNMKRIVG